jgi:hypothetical protein
MAASLPRNRRPSCLLYVQVFFSGPANAAAMLLRIASRPSRNEPGRIAVASSA